MADSPVRIDPEVNNGRYRSGISDLNWNIKKIYIGALSVEHRAHAPKFFG